MATNGNWRDLYPYESHFIERPDGRLHYLDEGAGETLLMVHGNPTWSFYWRNLIDAFCSSNRVVVPDHLGCGLSDKPQEPSYELSRHIDNLTALIEELDLRDITLLVHDWGGAIGMGTALKVPDRFSRFILFNTGVFPPPFIPFRIRACRTPILGRWAMRSLNLFARAAISMATEQPKGMAGQVRDGLLAPYDNWNNRVGIANFVRDIPLTRRHPTWETLEKIERELPTLNDRPSQLIWGMRDWCFTPACLDRIAELLPSAEIHRLEDAGHYVVEDAHEWIVPIIHHFLENNPLGSRETVNEAKES